MGVARKLQESSRGLDWESINSLYLRLLPGLSGYCLGYATTLAQRSIGRSHNRSVSNWRCDERFDCCTSAFEISLKERHPC
jgi:hypothetical protein